MVQDEADAKSSKDRLRLRLLLLGFIFLPVLSREIGQKKKLRITQVIDEDGYKSLLLKSYACVQIWTDLPAQSAP